MFPPMAIIDVNGLLRHMTDGFVAVGPDWQVRASNPAAERLLHCSAEKLGQADLFACIPDLSGSSAERDLRAAATSSVGRRVEHFSPSRYTWFELQVVPMPDGELYIFLRNVTDRARLMQSEAVRESVRRILTDAPVAISIMRGSEHRYEFTNQKSRQLVGGRDLEGRTARNAFPELAGSPLFDLLDEVYRTGVPYEGKNVPVRFDRAGNGEMHDGVFDFTHHPLTESDGRVWGILTVAVEVTEFAQERERLERARVAASNEGA